MPPAIALNTDLYAAKDHLFTATKVYSELNDIAVFYPEWLRLDIGLAQPNMIEECPGRAFDIFDVPAAVFAPKFTVFPAHDLGLEAYCRRGGHGRRVLGHVVAL